MQNSLFIIKEQNLGMHFLTIKEAHEWARTRSEILGAPVIKYADIRDAITFGDEMPKKNLKGYKRLHLSSMRFVKDPI